MTDEDDFLLSRCEEARLRILRGDGVIGIMPAEEVRQMVADYEALIARGVTEAAVGLAEYHLDENGLDYSPVAAAERAGAAVALGAKEARSVLRASVVRLRVEALEDPKNAQAAFVAIDQARGEADADGDAAYHAALLTFHGYGTTKSLERCVALHEEAAAKGNAGAMFELYVLHSTGQGTPKDEAKALAWCVKAADKGMARACFNLGAFYATGRGGVERDEKKAFAWYGKASMQGHGKATATLAYMTLRGEGCTASVERAEELFEFAAAQGFDVAAFREQLGIMR